MGGVLWAVPDDFDTLEGSSVSTSSPVCGSEAALALETVWGVYCSLSLSFILLNINAKDSLRSVWFVSKTKWKF